LYRYAALPEEIRSSVAVVHVEGGDDAVLPFPPDVKQCHQGPGTGARSVEAESCGWLGLSKVG
jgi:hypothetical protein